MSDELDLKEMKRIANVAINWTSPVVDPVSASLVRLIDAYEAMQAMVVDAERDFTDVHADLIRAVDEIGIFQDRAVKAEARLQIARDALEAIRYKCEAHSSPDEGELLIQRCLDISNNALEKLK